MKIVAEAIDTFDSSTTAISHIVELEKLNGVKVVSFANAHACRVADRDSKFEKALVDSSLLLRDGIGVKILLFVFGKKAGFNANGTDLIPLILTAMKSKKLILIGTEEEYLARTKCNLENNKHEVIGTMDGFQNFNKMLDFVVRREPEIILLGMGMPKQELFSSYLQASYDGNVLVINGGAIIDFMANRFDRAPAVMRDSNLEWLYRLYKEPRRLFDRYVVGIPLFICKVLHERLFG